MEILYQYMSLKVTSEVVKHYTRNCYHNIKGVEVGKY